MKLGTASIILLFLISSCCSFVLQPLVFKRYKHAVVQSIEHNSEENLLIEADKVLGTKNLLQQVSQLLYKKYPTLVWDDSARSLTITFGNVKYISTLDDDKSKSLSNAIKKQFEINAVRKLLYYLYESSGYRQIIMGYLNDKLNKDNAASVLSRDEALQIADKKLLVVLVDTENVGDFRKVFYVDRKGEIRFASKPLPGVTVAPSLSADSENDQSALSWLERNQQTFLDEDILILSYAQAKSQMRFRANRLSSARGRDAADCKNSHPSTN